MRALCDSGCQINLITPDAVQRLRVRKTPTQTKILGLGGTQASKGIVNLTISSPLDENASTQLKMYIHNRFLGPLPQTNVNTSAWPDIWRLPLADQTFHQSGPVDIVLGARFYGQIVKEGVKHFSNGPTAQNTSFGWIVFGNTHIPMCDIAIAAPIVANDDLMQALTRFWKLENAPMRHHRTPEEEMCEKIFTSTLKRDCDGRYIASIPIQPNPKQVTGSKQLALGRLSQMHKRFERDPILKANYVKFMTEYEQLGHMSLVPPKELKNPKAVYIPHHAAGTDKFRVVFDGSCKMKDSPSPNELQLNGERLQRDLTFIIARFRIGQVALCADIAKMYRQILVPPEQRDFQRIVWSPSAREPAREYRLNTQTYGMKSAAFVCIRTLLECAKNCEEAHPKVADTIKNNFYVDDMLRSEPNAESAIALYHELNKVMSQYGFTLAKWVTNDPQVNAILHSSDGVEIEMDRDNTNAVLGVHWNPSHDEFRYKVKNPPSDQIPTKRTIASDIARLFDPDGFLSPIIVRAKILIQRLWLRKMDWDDPVADSEDEKSDGIARDWAAFRLGLPDIEKIHIPRWIRMQPNATTQIHGFSDASQEAYGVAFYVRVKSNDIITSNLVFSKTRVAPLTKATVPKLELSAAHLLAKMLPTVMEAHFVTIDNCYLWTDSMIALQWIGKSPAKLEVFQANRVAEIQELTEGATWSHVATKDNPSDLCSRGMSPSKLSKNELWWHGPTWLLSPMSEWPQSNQTISIADTMIIEAAVKAPKPIASVAIVDFEAPLTRIVVTNHTQHEVGVHEAISNWRKLLRVTSYVMRFITNCRQKKRNQRRSGQIKRREMMSAENIWLQYSQEKHFGEEMADLRAKREISKKSSLYRLAPFIDGFGILRLSGRLRRADMPYDTIHPIVLTSKCTIAQRIVYEAHRKTYHGGNQLMQQYVRTKYWIIGLRIAIRSLVDHCYPCLRQKKRNAEQLMGQLPSTRVRKPNRAFLHSSVDYMGPFYVKRYNARRVRIVDKAYVAVFVCMATRAVHLELVSALTTEAFLAAFARFTNRRGCVESIRSDNGTNFEGASNEFDAIIADQWQEAADSGVMRNDGITWHFNPPYAPHMGGIHEAAVKSAKHHLRRVVGTQQLTFEEFATLLTHVEACLNSRPLTALPNKHSDSLALTPAHFLIGESLISPLMRDYTATPNNRLSHFELLQKFANEFWSRWSDEHVTSMINRTKWHRSQENLKRDDVVLVLSEPRPQTKWPLARVVNLYPDDEGKVRTVDVLFEKRIYKRPITQLCKLPEKPAF